MADISAIFGSLLIFGITFPGMLTAWWLLFPAVVERARLRLERTPWKCFWLGLGISLAGVVPIGVLLALPSGLAKFLGFSLIAILLSVSSVGAAGIAAQMGTRIVQTSHMGSMGGFVRGALALELAVFFPLLGWVIALPLTILTALGASGFAVLRWSPKSAAVQTPVADAAALQA